MRIEPGHGNARRASQASAQRLMRDAQGLQDLRPGHGLDGLAQRDMDADQHGAQLVVRQHHAHRHLFQRNARMGSRLGLQKFRVPGESHACQMQRLLVQGCRDQGGNLATQSCLRGPDHTLRRGLPGSCANLAIGLGPRQPRQVQQRDSTFRNRPGFARLIDHHHGLGDGLVAVGGPRCQRSRTAQSLQLAHYKAAAHGLRCSPKSLGDDFRPYACTVALGDGNGLG
ncbi:hypothetical protein SDC9_159395 [bioreactor metagenome]|uniref:Uncharacterized protein n=1 Tax=bioreactor metagenome TaxID=1076179 RepID=A0A645FCI6_9ZZZZ